MTLFDILLEGIIKTREWYSESAVIMLDITCVQLHFPPRLEELTLQEINAANYQRYFDHISANIQNVDGSEKEDFFVQLCLITCSLSHISLCELYIILFDATTLKLLQPICRW